MVELRSLRLVHRHGEDCLDLHQPARHHETYATAAIVSREGHAQNQLCGGARHPEGDADVTIHQVQTVVIAGDQYRPPFIPAMLTRQQFTAAQFGCHPLVQPLHAPRPAT
ncbi:hypothetical protein D3C80_1362430 [compost metagenome]